MVLCIKQEKAMASWPSIRRIPPETFEALHEYLKSGINPRTKKSAKARLARWKKVFELEDGKLVLKTDVPQPGILLLFSFSFYVGSLFKPSETLSLQELFIMYQFVFNLIHKRPKKSGGQNPRNCIIGIWRLARLFGIQTTPNTN